MVVVQTESPCPRESLIKTYIRLGVPSFSSPRILFVAVKSLCEDGLDPVERALVGAVAAVLAVVAVVATGRGVGVGGSYTAIGSVRSVRGDLVVAVVAVALGLGLSSWGGSGGGDDGRGGGDQENGVDLHFDGVEEFIEVEVGCLGRSDAFDDWLLGRKLEDDGELMMPERNSRRAERVLMEKLR